MNTENSKTNEPTFCLTLVDRLNLKDHKKNMALTNLSITNGRILRLHVTTIN